MLAKKTSITELCDRHKPKNSILIMKKYLPLHLLLLAGCITTSATAQNLPTGFTYSENKDSIYEKLRGMAFAGMEVSPEMDEVLKHTNVLPQTNRAKVALHNRTAANKAPEGMNGNFRPAEIITKNELGETFMKYSYTYDEAGTFSDPGVSMVRDYKIWNKIENVWDNNMRFKRIVDENGDIVEAFTDTGFKDSWDNYYRVTMEYDGNHNQTKVCQDSWENNKWYGKLRWENTYDANGNILTQTYQSRPTDGEWANGSQHTWRYDEDGHEVFYSIGHWSDASQAYSVYLSNEYTYDSNGNQLTHERGQYGSPFFFVTNTYDTDNNQLTRLETRWQNEEWVNYSYITYSYDEQNRVKEKTTQMWVGDKETGSWNNQNKEVSIYFDTATSLTYQKWDAETETWKDSERIINAYNDNGQQTRWAHDYWSEELKRLQTGEQIRYDYDENYNLTEYTSETWHMGEQKFIPTSHFVFSYDENNNGIEVLADRKQAKEYIYLPYHNMADEWASPDFDSWIGNATYLDLREYIKTTGISLNHNSYELEPELNVQLEASIQPENASNKEVHWTSSNEEVAYVSVDGRVYGVSPGTATIQARTLNGNHIASCEINVTDINEGINEVKDEALVVFDGQYLHFKGNGIKSIEVFDTSGRLLHSQNTTASVATTPWNAGIYIVKLHTEKGNKVQKLQLK